MTRMDAIAQFKENARQGWVTFAPLETLTGLAAPRLVKFAAFKPGARLLDVGCGTGVVAMTATRAGAKASGVDLTPELIERAHDNAKLAHMEIDFKVGDAEELPYEDAAFDVVVSQFGHMFAPRPEFAVREMLRVLKPGGIVAFSTWPPELFTGRMFAITGKYAPPPPPGVSPPPQWGDPNIVHERLGSGVKSLTFDRAAIHAPGLSPAHIRLAFESNVGPLGKLTAALAASDPAKLAQLRAELEALVEEYFEDNGLRQSFLMSRAIKA